MRSTDIRQSIAAFIVVVVVVLCARAVLTAQSPGAERLDPALLAEFDRQGDASYLVVLRRLQQSADLSQRDVRAFLRARQHSGEVRRFRPFWIVNAPPSGT